MADFSVTSCTASRSVLAPEDTIDITMTVKNTFGSKLTKFGLCLCFTNADLGYSGNGWWQPTVSPESSISWANAASKTFTWSINPATIMSVPGYSSSFNRVKSVLQEKKTLPFRLALEGTSSDGGYANMTYTLSGVIYIDQWYHPVITLDAWRYPDDESESLAATMKVELADGPNASRFTATMYYAQDAKATTASSTFAMNVDRDVLFGVGYSANTAVLPGTFSNGSAFSFLLVVSDGYETASAQVTVDRAFANVHLSGKTTGGVAFGRFSTATQGNPKFECEFPALFYGGIEEVNINWQPLTVASGITTPYSAKYGGGALKCGKVGKHVYITGSIQGKSGATITTLPEGFRPLDGNKYFLKACSGARIARIIVNTAGVMSVEWLRLIKDATEYTTAIWIDCNIDFWIRD